MDPVRTSSSNVSPRSHAPVFVLGSPRSGTTLLYDMLLSSGGFAVYLAESNVFNLLVPRFGDLHIYANRKRLVDAWVNSKLFRASGLDAEDIRSRIMAECENGGDFLNLVMSEMCAAQQVWRWAENSPEGMLYLPLIKRLIPNALFVHIVRDGRDVATSLGKLHYIRAFPWEERHGLIGCGLYWEWMVEHGRRFGQSVPADYLEVRFEDLLTQPQATLDKVGRFIDQPLDYKIIQSVAYGSVTKPNTSFRQEAAKADFNPIGRWRKSFSPDQLLRFERLVGKTLADLGYEPSTNGAAIGLNLPLRGTRLLHRAFFAGKLVYKNSRVVRALRPQITGPELDEIVLADDHAPVIKQPSANSV
jgi:hypothetical protein